MLASDGNFYQVIQPVRHEFNGTMLEIEAYSNFQEIHITREHQVLAVKPIRNSGYIKNNEMSATTGPMNTHGRSTRRIFSGSNSTILLNNQYRKAVAEIPTTIASRASNRSFTAHLVCLNITY